MCNECSDDNDVSLLHLQINADDYAYTEEGVRYLGEIATDAIRAHLRSEGRLIDDRADT